MLSKINTLIAGYHSLFRFKDVVYSVIEGCEALRDLQISLCGTTYIIQQGLT